MCVKELRKVEIEYRDKAKSILEDLEPNISDDSFDVEENNGEGKSESWWGKSHGACGLL